MVLVTSCGGSSGGDADQRDPSVAREWSEVMLEGIRNDFARPTVHARNLFHISSAMYDAWAAFDDTSGTYLLGNQIENFQCAFDGIAPPAGVQSAREEAISYAAYRLIMYRFRLSPRVLDTEDVANELFGELGYDAGNDSLDYSAGSPAALGNYIADCYIRFGLQDGSNERGFFENVAYEPVNPPIDPEKPGNPDIVNLDRWQQVSLDLFIDQAGNPIGTDIPFLSPEWGSVIPFALTDVDKTVRTRDGFDYEIYYDPGFPPLTTNDLSELYRKGFAMVSVWSSHLDPFDPDGVSIGDELIDISPRSLGSPDNFISADGQTGFYPINFLDNYFRDTCDEDPVNGFYCYLDGGDRSTGYDINPATGEPYEEQLVPLGDYARVLAEFWADGPDSETPPGHWFTIFNEVSDHPELVKSIGGQGPEVGPLEWDIKGYFIMGGAMHDCAISAWGIKGFYDYLRPVSAIRAMADRGQSSDPSLVDSYSPDGIPLYEGFIEVIVAGDPLAGANNEHVNKIKVLAWRGPDFIGDTQAGVGWIRAENWWPYQRPSFVTPPFAGYVSGHSTYSRAAAEVMTLYTGDAYFPGGKSEFFAPANEFLVFEEGPSVDVVLEWATYRDASDQTSLSRIWGGIHPPADDIPGRIIGAQIGPAAYELAERYFNGE